MQSNNTAKIDLLIIVVINSLACIGLLFIWSTTIKAYAFFSLFFQKQFLGILAGNVLYLLSSKLDFRSVLKYSYFLYPIFLIMLLYTLFRGHIGLGGQRWINLGFLKFQPSELGKIMLPSFSIYYLSIAQNRRFRFFFVLICLFASFLLIRKQPDLGTAVIIFLIGLLLVWFAGLPKKIFYIGFIGCIITAPYLFTILKSYQKERIAVFFGYGNPLKERYQTEQSIIAIGSGGLWGKGLLKGTQNKLQFLPEGRTDFVFAVLCEEWGLLGALLLLILYGILFTRIFIIISQTKNRLMQLYGVGITLHIFLSTIINISMVLGMLPIVGIPLPFCSYGLTNLWVNYISLGFLNNITYHQMQELH